MKEIYNLLGINNKETRMDMIKKFSFIFILYLISIFTLIRSNYKYIDDMGRATEGYKHFDFFSRHVSNILSSIFHVNPNHLTDIAPLTQIIACVFLACASIILVYVLNEKKITYIHLIASMALGISPWFLECLSYHFDAPYMALSILVSIVPFIFLNDIKKYFIISVLGILLMCMSYQASSGVYIIITLTISFLMFIKKETNCTNILKFILISVIAYVVAWFMFMLLFQNTAQSATYARPSIIPFNELFIGVLRNAKKYILLIYRDSAIAWKFLFLICLVLSLFNCINLSKRNKIFTFVFTLFIMCITAILSKGVYLAITSPMFTPRGDYGIGIFIAIILVLAIPQMSNRKTKYLLTIPVIYFVYSLVVFSFTYGNALESQDKYVDFKYNMIATDLINVMDDNKSINIKFEPFVVVGYSSEVNNIGKDYPIIKKLIREYRNPEWVWSYTKLSKNYSIKFKVDNKLTDENVTTVVSNYYYDIKKDKNNYIVKMKK